MHRTHDGPQDHSRAKKRVKAPTKAEKEAFWTSEQGYRKQLDLWDDNIQQGAFRTKSDGVLFIANTTHTSDQPQSQPHDGATTAP
ncbi:hypothetical protein IAR50_001189 [Cryptococcus sp. DSM 104548]